MKRKKVKIIIALTLPIQILLVKWMGSYPLLIEKYYSNGIYPGISRFLRLLFGWIPFSVGDIFYLLLFWFAGKYLYKNWKAIRRKPLLFGKDILVVLSIAYFTFHFLWGMNYYRLPIEQKFLIQRDYSKMELSVFTQYLIRKSNYYQMQITGDSLKPVEIPYARREIFKKTREGYKRFKKTHPDFEYTPPSIKASLFSLPLTYMGYGGYLNPFSNEAQVNGIAPLFRLPVVSGHEVGHQLGYSAEDDTNFIGFLVTSQNEDPYFKYAAYSHALSYCLSDLSRKDKKELKVLVNLINPGVIKNFTEVSDFWADYKNPLEPVFKSIFNTFLKANNQKEGIQSYNSVVGLLISYHNQYGF